MKICAVCNRVLPQESFDAEQWLMNQHQMKCRECIDSDRVAQPNAESPSGHGHGIPDQCYLCFGEGLDDSGQPLRRDCSCRNGTGPVHLSCLVEYAKHRTITGGDFDPWAKCPNCFQHYQGELDLDLANEEVAFCRQKYPDNELFLLNAMRHKLAALALNNRPKEAEEIGHRMITVIEQKKSESTSPKLKFLLIMQAGVNMMLGGIALHQETADGAKTALKQFEKSRDIFDGLGDEFSFRKGEAEFNIANAKDMLGEGSIGVKERLLMEQNRYERCIQDHGRESTATILRGVKVAFCLERVQRSAEAKALLTKLATISRRAHGRNHEVTKRVESQLKNLEMVEATDEDICGDENSAEGNGKVGGPVKSE